jgi:plasmid stability protein
MNANGINESWNYLKSFELCVLRCWNRGDKYAINDCNVGGECYHRNQLIRNPAGKSMANLVVRNLDQRIVDALKLRAAQHGRSAEAEHRALLEELLLRPKGKSFAEALSAMPNVGQDGDFERVQGEGGDKDVFD